ncbi:MAG: VanZ family protein [Vicinamibacterales bacterium]
MVRQRLVLAVTAAAAIILSAPIAQEAFGFVSTAWPRQFDAIAVGATAVPAGIALLVAVARIRDRHLVRYGLLAVAVTAGAAYIFVNALGATESVHFIEYGLLGVLFYRAWRSVDDVSLFVLPVVAGTIAGIVDEWFQWFIPIRAGEARDIVLNTVASACGLLFATSLDPPGRLALRLPPGSRVRVARWTAAGLVVFAAFFLTVHVGYDVGDPEIGSFRSRYSAETLERASRDRAGRWHTRPPLVQRRLWREDQYLTEGLWHVGRRNDAWADGDVVTAWWENRILEKFYAPVLDSPTYAGAAGHRWPAAQRADAAERAAPRTGPHASEAYAYPLYVWPRVF